MQASFPTPCPQRTIDGSTDTATDRYGGISAIYIGNEYFAGNDGTTLETYSHEEHLHISAADYAGNIAKTAVVQNPYYTGAPGAIISEVTAFSGSPADLKVAQGGEKNESEDAASVLSGMTMYSMSCETANGGYIYHYAVGSAQIPDNISRKPIDIRGIACECSHTEIIAVCVANTEKVTELVEFLSESEDVTDITACLRQTIIHNKIAPLTLTD